jgi:hypothetical protein
LAQLKKAKVGRPKLPKGEAKGKIVPVRFAKEDLRSMEVAARVRQKTLSEWVRIALSLEAKQRYNGCLIELATRPDEGGFIAFGWITPGTNGARPISFEAPGRYPTKQAAIDSGIEWCQGKMPEREHDSCQSRSIKSSN